MGVVPAPGCEVSRAPDIARRAAELIEERGADRDTDGERTMGRAVAAFNALRDADLTESEGWLLLMLLKQSRAAGGRFCRDDHDDTVGYAALKAEAELDGR